ncbi:hypothetical protein MGQ_04217 [Candida albicans P76067]|nr:hypothetical protein MGQ_04217 [Candida albicans P76067]
MPHITLLPHPPPTHTRGSSLHEKKKTCFLQEISLIFTN